jgi:DNA-directed RNA polymerase subunit RPC12/RpoP
LKTLECPKCGSKYSYKERKQLTHFRGESPHPDFRGEDEYYPQLKAIKCPKCGNPMEV